MSGHWIARPEVDPRSYLAIERRGVLQAGHRGRTEAECPVCSGPPVEAPKPRPKPAPKPREKPNKVLLPWEILVVAASKVSEACDGAVPCTELVIAAWGMSQTRFGLDKKQTTHPDTALVLDCIENDRLVLDGYLKRIGHRLWALTPKGWQFIHDLRKFKVVVEG